MSFNSKDTKGYWAANGTALYKPQGCEITHENYVGSNSGRTEDGVMHIDWLRRDLRKVTIKYNAMTGNEMDELVGLVQGKEYTATFRDRGKTCTMSAYTGDCKYELYNETLCSSEGGLYTDVSFDMVEM